MLLTEMCGRLAAVSHHTLADAIRERLGLPYFAEPEGDHYVATGFHIGPAALLERLAVRYLGVTFGGRWHGYRVRWDQIDLEDPRRLRLTCGVEDLGRLPAPQKRRAG